MAKKIRFPLKMNGVDVRTIEELREYFDLESILGYFADGKLVTWLRNRYYDKEADAVEALSHDDEKLAKKLCGILKVTYAEEVSEIDMAFIKRRQEKTALLRQFTSDESMVSKIDAIAFNQEDLLDILDTGTEKMIYLCRGEFDIPLTVTGITYVGLDNPVVMLRAYDNVDFSSLNLKFVDICYGWNVSNITSADKVYQAETLIKLGKKDKAREILKEVVITKNPRACYILYKIDGSKDSSLIHNELDVFACVERKVSDSMMLKALERMTTNKDDVAMFLLGKCYHSGIGTEIDYSEAVKWYHKSSELGNALAQNNLGNLYKDGEGVEQNFEKAVEWYYKSASQGNANAQNSLGGCYEKGKGIEQSWEKAVEWYQKSAEQGNNYAQSNLGDCYYYGNGVEKDYFKAVEWYQKAGEQGHAYAQYSLGWCYEYGQGVNVNTDEAVRWYQLSAKQNHASAQEQLKKMNRNW